jgi:hypothetical protein
MIFAAFIYLSCAAASLGCVLLLLRSWRRTRKPLLLWITMGFGGLFANNVLLVIDLLVLPNSVDLTVPRLVTTLLGVGVLVGGLIWEST